MEFSRQEYWSRFPVPTPGDLPDSGIEPASLESPALAGRVCTVEPPTPVPPSSLCDRCCAGGLPLSGSSQKSLTVPHNFLHTTQGLVAPPRKHEAVLLSLEGFPLLEGRSVRRPSTTSKHKERIPPGRRVEVSQRCPNMISELGGGWSSLQAPEPQRS